MFNVTIGKEGLSNSWQDNFPEVTECVHCKGESRIGFVAFEEPLVVSKGSDERNEQETFIFHLHNNDPGGEGFWLHDCCAVAVYFCKNCLNPTALYNQG